MVGKFGFFLFVHESLPVKTVPDFLNYVRANPEKVNYATGKTVPAYSPPRSSRWLRNWTCSTFRTEATRPATSDLIAGRVQMMIGTPGSAMPQVQEGRCACWQPCYRVAVRWRRMRRRRPRSVRLGLQSRHGPAYSARRNSRKRLSIASPAAMKVISARQDVRASLDKIAFELQNSTPEEMATLLKGSA